MLFSLSTTKNNRAVPWINLLRQPGHLIERPSAFCPLLTKGLAYRDLKFISYILFGKGVDNTLIARKKLNSAMPSSVSKVTTYRMKDGHLITGGLFLRLQGQ